MTTENQKKRDLLKSIEVKITTALAHQPEDDEHCREFLDNTICDIRDEMKGFFPNVCNAAAMHEALKKVSRWLEGGLAYCHRRRVGEVVQVPAISGFYVLDAVNAALDAHPRNCDALSKEEALAELDSRSFSKEDTIEWLYAVKGEVDGSK